MGAVFGIVGDASPAELETMSERLAHRGSHAATWSPAPLVHLGMRGTAAAVGQAEGGYLVFDGAIDNRTELATLINRSEPKGASPDDDPGLMRDLLRAVGKECLQHVAGQFALVMWDRAGEQLFLARDRIGYAPLYFTLEGARLIFASEYKALLAIPSVPARPNRNAIQVIQSTKWMQPGATCLEGIFPVAPGTWMAVEQNRLFTARFWDIPIQVRKRDERAHVAALRGVFLETLRRQTEPYHRIGISLSGGLDSAIMAGGVRHVAPAKEIHTFSAGHGPDDRELLNAERVAAELGSYHHPLILSPDDLPDLLPWMLWYMEEPIGREDIAYLYVVAREAARHVELILTGFGFDGLFAGLPRHRVADLALRAPAFAGPLREFYDYTVRSVEPSGVGGRALKQMYFRGSDYPAPQVKGAAALEPLPGFNLGGDQPLSRFLRKGFLLLPYQSAVERLYTGSGVRFNAHHTDPAFLACAFSIPDRLKIKGRTQKYVLRKACAGLLSPAILDFGKSFNRLKHDLHLSNVLDGLAEQVLARDAVLDRGLFDPQYIADLRHRSGRTPYSQERAYRLWSLLLAEMWCRIYLDARGSPPGMAQG